MARPRVNAEGQKELDRAENQIKSSVDISLENFNELPFKDVEPQTKIATSDLDKNKTVYLKPKRTFPSREKFNERFRDDYNYQREYVEFIAENVEVKGESIDLCIKKFPGTPVEEWVIPTNKPISAPRYVKERLEECNYTVFTMSDNQTDSEGGMAYYGQMVAEERRSRLTARDVPKTRQVYMGRKFAA